MSNYYLPKPTHWPIIGSTALICMTAGGANWLHGVSYGPYMLALGFCLLLTMLYGWFGTVINENRTGLLEGAQMDRSFRISMVWFIFSEVMFFGAFFSALFFARLITVPLISGHASEISTHIVLWPNFTNLWPISHNPNPLAFVAPHSVMPAWGLPAINTLILLTSGVTITIAHWAILKNQRIKMAVFQLLTVLLGISFLVCQVHEYIEAYTEKGLTMASGIYGTTFFLLTGFHGLHVTIGTIGLMVILYRMLKGDFTPKNHFAFEAVAWYWHFVDVVWLLLFVLVYWL